MPGHYRSSSRKFCVAVAAFQSVVVGVSPGRSTQVHGY